MNILSKLGKFSATVLIFNALLFTSAFAEHSTNILLGKINTVSVGYCNNIDHVNDLRDRAEKNWDIAVGRFGFLVSLGFCSTSDNEEITPNLVIDSFTTSNGTVQYVIEATINDVSVYIITERNPITPEAYDLNTAIVIGQDYEFYIFCTSLRNSQALLEAFNDTSTKVGFDPVYKVIMETECVANDEFKAKVVSQRDGFATDYEGDVWTVLDVILSDGTVAYVLWPTFDFRVLTAVEYDALEAVVAKQNAAAAFNDTVPY